LTNDEIEKYHIEIEKIIGYLDRLDSISLSDVEPRHYERRVSEFRDDIIYDNQTDLSKTTKYSKEGYVKGPRMR
jgi:aspartyl/glutamyl-tRNA(Asn/Gln) amidotransferase C subunit